MTRASRTALHVGALTLALIALAVVPSYGQSSTSNTPPPTQDNTFASSSDRQRGRMPSVARHRVERSQRERQAHQCAQESEQRPGQRAARDLRPSAVDLLVGAGGGMQSLQPVKTVTQFRLARSRIDQRLTTKKPTPPRKP
jgi:septal ring-binding cell division protein DamX